MLSVDKDNIEDPSLLDLVYLLWSRKKIIVLFTLFFSIIAIAFSLYLPNKYKVEALLVPNIEQNANGVSLGGLSSIAAIAGANISSSSTKVDEGIEVLKSLEFFEDFMEQLDTDISLALVASRGWDLETNNLIIDSDIFDTKNNIWVRDKPPLLKKVIPSSQELHEEFLEIFAVSRDDETGFITLSIEHYSPYLIKDWMEHIILLINNRTREKDELEATISNKFLLKMINEVSLPEVRETLSDLVQSQTKTIMIAKASPEYLFKVISKPVLMETKSAPNRLSIFILGLILGFLFGVFYVLIQYYIFRKQQVFNSGK